MTSDGSQNQAGMIYLEGQIAQLVEHEDGHPTVVGTSPNSIKFSFPVPCFFSYGNLFEMSPF